MRKIKIWRDIFSLSIVGAFIILSFVFEMRVWVRTLFVVMGGVYVVYLLFRLKNSIDQYYALTEDLIIKGGHIVKVSPKVGVTLWKMPLDNIIKVFPNVKSMPHTMYILFEKDGKKGAENFYKHRIKDPKKLEEIFKKRDVLDERYISLKELKRRVE